MISHKPKDYVSPFTRILSCPKESAAEIIYQNEQAFVCLGLHRYQNCPPSALVIPKVAAENIYVIEPATLSAVVELSQQVAIAMKQLWQLDGITLMQNNEPAGWQDVWHFHMHVKGRKAGDSMWGAKQERIPQSERAELIAELREFMIG
ncbi:HIT family protein [Salinibius halmophilus]|uniref:HIT family protein n=1 Tax=Salinibius halmophilus TaxID=1853216 RepID=UPI000E675397|nr:HIT family protein [Salinibius halmophilus]